MILLHAHKQYIYFYSFGRKNEKQFMACRILPKGYIMSTKNDELPMSLSNTMVVLKVEEFEQFLKSFSLKI